MAPETVKCRLKIEGKYLTVLKFSSGLHLCAKDVQGGSVKAPSVDMMINTEQQVAFRFKRKDGTYVLRVDGEGLKMEKTDNGNNPSLTKSHWFKKTSFDTSVRYQLQSVVQPCKSLSLARDQNDKIILSDEPAPISERIVA